MKNSLGIYELNDRVIIRRVIKQSYHDYPLLHRVGTITKISNQELGILMDTVTNGNSHYGIFWFKPEDVELFKKEGTSMRYTIIPEFNKVAKVILLGDSVNKPTNKVYNFRLYDENVKEGDAVVVNPRSEDNRVLGRVTEVVTDYTGPTPTAEVVAVVDFSNYDARQNALERKRRSLIRKAEIEKELDDRIGKIHKSEMYEAIAKRYADLDPDLMKLVTELKSLE